jgi:hypothetical protein
MTQETTETDQAFSIEVTQQAKGVISELLVLITHTMGSFLQIEENAADGETVKRLANEALEDLCKETQKIFATNGALTTIPEGEVDFDQEFKPGETKTLYVHSLAPMVGFALSLSAPPKE